MLENKYDITMYQGSTYELLLTLKDPEGNSRDLTDYSAKMQIRPAYTSSVITSELSTATGEININTSNSSIYICLPAGRTANIKVDMASATKDKPPYSTYVYDLELTDADSKVSKLMYGSVLIYGEVTR